MVDLFENKDKHESYGMLQFSRVSGGAKALFGSSIRYKDTIKSSSMNKWRKL